MGVKSTIYKTRKEAEEQYVELLIESKIRRFLTSAVLNLSNTELEDKLEEMNDEASGGEGVENYIITE